MVDLHCHILPGLDDGAPTMEAALDLARAAEAAGVETVVATPHIRDDHPFPLELIEERLEALRAALTEAEIAVNVVGGGEVSLPKLTQLDDATLEALCLGDGPYLLVESPYGQAPSLLETALFDLQVRGFRPVLAHPERSMTFRHDLARLERLVERGIVCSVTAMSVTGGFGRTVRDFTLRLFPEGLVHNIASDAHDATRRASGFSRALAALQTEFDCDAASATWFAEAAGRAILEGGDLTPGPPALRRRFNGWKRMTERVGLGRSATNV